MDNENACEARQPRRRDAAATRAALLTAARELMAQHGVEGTSTRDIAATAGVNQALVYRYFGSKEKLFAEAVSGGAEEVDSVMVITPLAEVPRTLVNRLLDHADSAEFQANSLSSLVTSANDDTVRTYIRDRIDRSFGIQLASRLDGPDAELRAELLAALITGIGFLRGKVGTPAISAADHQALEFYVELMAAPLLVAQQRPDQQARPGDEAKGSA